MVVVSIAACSVRRGDDNNWSSKPILIRRGACRRAITGTFLASCLLPGRRQSGRLRHRHSMQTRRQQQLTGASKRRAAGCA